MRCCTRKEGDLNHHQSTSLRNIDSKVLDRHLKSTHTQNGNELFSLPDDVKQHLPSKLPAVSAKAMSFPYVSALGLNTKTPELKQSGQPTSGAAENSSRSKSSSLF